MSIEGLAVGASAVPYGSELVADAAAGATVLEVDFAGDFQPEGGTLDLDGVRMDYTAADRSTGLITLAAPLAGLVETDTRVEVVRGGEVSYRWVVLVDTGGVDPVEVPMPFEQRMLWPVVQEYDDPVPVVLSDDQRRIVEVPGRTPAMDSAMIDTPSIRMVNNGADQALLPSTWYALTNWSPLISTGGVSYDAGTGRFYNFSPGLWMIEAQVFIQDDPDGRRLLRANLYTSIGEAEIARAIESTPGATGQRDMLRFTATFPLIADHAVAIEGWHNGTTSPTTLGFGLSGSPTALSYIQLTRLPG